MTGYLVHIVTVPYAGTHVGQEMLTLSGTLAFGKFIIILHNDWCCKKRTRISAWQWGKNFGGFRLIIYLDDILLLNQSERASAQSKRHPVASTDVGVCHKLGEVCFGPVTRDGVLGFCHRFPSFKLFSSRIKGGKQSTRMCGDAMTV